MTAVAATAYASRLIIADDSPEMRALVRNAFAGSRFEVTEAADGRQLFWALERYCASPDTGELVVIADIRMPVYTGLDVLEAWGSARWPFPFVVITSYPDDETRARVEQRGAVLLPKPFAIADLRRAVSSIAP